MEGPEPAVFHSVALLWPLLPPLWTPGAMAGGEAAAGFRGTGISAAPRTPGAYLGGRRASVQVPLWRPLVGRLFLLAAGQGGDKTSSIPWSGRTAEAIAMPGGEGEPAVAAGSPFSGPCAAADAGGPIRRPWGAGNPVVPRAPVHIGTGGDPLRPPFLAAFGGPPFSCSTLDGVVAETRVVPWWGGGSTVRAPAGEGESSAFQRGEGAPVAQGEGICCARQGEGLPAVHGGGEARPVCQQGGGDRCTR